ncbi:SCO family protein [Hymenobacter sp. BRD128]|uniref:SCO family protein n=1 Tax=Hymenobacter sp. BRD128 TaxID=2675878 RepID=UPI0015633D9C|nr:SCO family protein [Hymenobacter sp. BRD128]QKG56122.1 SCO family protein [Hymenobacter sp. BRD128]
MFLKYLPLAGLLALAACGPSTPATDDTGIADVHMDAQEDSTSATLPYLGAEGKKPVLAFSLPDQEGKIVSTKSLAGKVYVTDFFFATCPGICPKMQSELLRVYKQFAANPNVVFVSFTIDPEHDTQPVLADYARRLGVNAPASTWRFVRTPDRPAAYKLANSYLAAAETDLKAPGGIAHSGALALVDDQGYVRGTYDGLNAAAVNRLIRQLPVLLAEVNARKATAAR